MIVVDTNIIAHLYLQGEHTAQAEKVLQKDSDMDGPVVVAIGVSQRASFLPSSGASLA